MPLQVKQLLSGKRWQARDDASLTSAVPHPPSLPCPTPHHPTPLLPLVQVWDSLVALFYTRIIEDKLRAQPQAAAASAAQRATLHADTDLTLAWRVCMQVCARARVCVCLCLRTRLPHCIHVLWCGYCHTLLFQLGKTNDPAFWSHVQKL